MVAPLSLSRSCSTTRSMKLMITSFGVQHSLSFAEGQESMFHHMPPVVFRRINDAFMPDYALLLLCDTVIMDEVSFDRLVRGSVGAFSEVSETFQALETEGRIELVDFSLLLRSHTDLLDRMVAQDLKLLDQWVAPLRESLFLWGRFSQLYADLICGEHGIFHGKLQNETQRGQSILFHQMGNMISLINSNRHTVEDLWHLLREALSSSAKRKRRQYRSALREALRSYLTYVDANLILSHQLDVGFHDWRDFTPFYAAKFLAVGRDQDPVKESGEMIEKLFTVSFPELAINDSHALMKALNDKRVRDLRSLVAEAVDGRVQFDHEFARSVLFEVFQVSERAKKWRTVAGYATLPIGFIPWIGTPIQKAVEEGVGVPIEKKFKREHRWFYMLSEIADNIGKKPAEQ